VALGMVQILKGYCQSSMGGQGVVYFAELNTYGYVHWPGSVAWLHTPALHHLVFASRLSSIIIIFYCGLMTHITDTRAQKVVSYTSAHITETVFAHDQP